MNASAEEQVAELRSWLLARNPDLEELAPDADLLEGALRDSLEFVACLIFVEELRGAPIVTDNLDRESFRTLETIRDAFLTATGSAR